MNKTSQINFQVRESPLRQTKYGNPISCEQGSKNKLIRLWEGAKPGKNSNWRQNALAKKKKKETWVQLENILKQPSHSCRPIDMNSPTARQLF